MTTDIGEIHTNAAYINGIAVYSADVRIEHERLDVTTEYEPDPTWVHIDANDHFHAWSLDGTKHTDRLPTLNSRPIEEPCNGNCDDDVCEGYTRTEYTCRLCGEVIEPKSRRTFGTKHMPGLMTWTVEVQMLANDALPPIGRDNVSFWTDMAKARNYFGVGYIQKTAHGIGDLVTATIHGIGPLGERAKP